MNRFIAILLAVCCATAAYAQLELFSKNDVAVSTQYSNISIVRTIEHHDATIELRLEPARRATAANDIQVRNESKIFVIAQGVMINSIKIESAASFTASVGSCVNNQWTGESDSVCFALASSDLSANISKIDVGYNATTEKRTFTASDCRYITMPAVYGTPLSFDIFRFAYTSASFSDNQLSCTGPITLIAKDTTSKYISAFEFQVANAAVDYTVECGVFADDLTAIAPEMELDDESCTIRCSLPLNTRYVKITPDQEIFPTLCRVTVDDIVKRDLNIRLGKDLSHISAADVSKSLFVPLSLPDHTKYTCVVTPATRIRIESQTNTSLTLTPQNYGDYEVKIYALPVGDNSIYDSKVLSYNGVIEEGKLTLTPTTDDWTIYTSALGSTVRSHEIQAASSIDILINDSTTCTAAPSVQIDKLIVKHDAVLEIMPNVVLRAAQVEQNSVSNIILRSTQEGTGALILTSEQPAASAVVELFSGNESPVNDAGVLSNPVWQYVGVAVDEHTQLVDDHSTAVIPWLEEEQAWGTRGVNAIAMQPWRAYALAQTGATTYSTSGNLIFDDHTFLIPEGATLFANSYAAPVDISKVEESDFESSDMTIYIYNASSYNGYKQSNYDAYPINIASELPRHTIAAMQGFMVRSSEGGSLTFDYDRHVVQADAADNMLRARSSSNNVELRLLAAGYYSRFQLFEKANTTADFDNGYDARLIKATDAPCVYSVSGENRLTIDSRAELNGARIGISAPEGEACELQFAVNLNGYAKFNLIDTKANRTLDLLSQKSYRFTALADESTSPRFTVEAQKTPAAIDLIDDDLPVMRGSEVLFSNSKGGEFRIFTTTGVELFSTYVGEGCQTVTLPSLPAGVYLGMFGNKTFKFVRARRTP